MNIFFFINIVFFLLLSFFPSKGKKNFICYINHASVISFVFYFAQKTVSCSHKTIFIYCFRRTNSSYFIPRREIDKPILFCWENKFHKNHLCFKKRKKRCKLDINDVFIADDRAVIYSLS